MRKNPEINTLGQRRRLFRLGLQSLCVLLATTALGMGLALTPAGFAGAGAPTSQEQHLVDFSAMQQIRAVIAEKESPTLSVLHNAWSDESGHVKRRSDFGCLPQGAQLNDVVRYGGSRNGNVTVEKTLAKMKAQCRKGKLVDAKRREIRFFRPSCWGNAPSDYLEIQQRENAELERLKRRYTVIVFSCNPMIQ